MSNRHVRAQTATIWFAPTARRRYLTMRAAIVAEARARINAKHPIERAEYDDQGRLTFGGWHWSSMPRAQVLLRRVCRQVRRSIMSDSAEVRSDGE